VRGLNLLRQRVIAARGVLLLRVRAVDGVGVCVALDAQHLVGVKRAARAAGARSCGAHHAEMPPLCGLLLFLLLLLLLGSLLLLWAVGLARSVLPVQAAAVDDAAAAAAGDAQPLVLPLVLLQQWQPGHGGCRHQAAAAGLEGLQAALARQHLNGVPWDVRGAQIKDVSRAGTNDGVCGTRSRLVACSMRVWHPADTQWVVALGACLVNDVM
jgi:hypothetical protein